MFSSTRKALPTLDYVSLVGSLYKDRRAMLFGTLASALGAAAAAYQAGSTLLYVHAFALLVLVVTRDLNMRAFARANIDPADGDTAEYWERRAEFFGYFAAIAYGSWCFSSLAFVGEPFAELLSVSVTIAAMVGIAMRNFGSDRLMTIQILGMGGPLVLGLALGGDIYHFVLGSLFLPLLVSFRSLGRDVRNILLTAVHDRVDASRLAVQLDTALETMQHGLCMLDENGVIAVANDRAQQTFAGIGEGSWVGQHFADLASQAIERRALPRASAERLLRMIETQSAGKVVLKLSDDYYCEVTISSRQDRTVLLFENVSQRVRAQERINFMARYDTLTNLPNRAHFSEQVEADLARRRRAGDNEPAVLMIVDLDDFKHVNDTLGHLVGDQVLSEAAARIQTVMHRQSLLARFGGDEFILYRSGRTSEGEISAEASAILKAFSLPIQIGGERLDVRASIGLVSAESGEASLDELTSRADLALYRAKARGKGQWQPFHEDMDTEFRYRQKLKADLRDAIAENRLRLVYQPLVNIRTRQVESCEALARWDHSELGAIPPAVFIGLAEEIGAISDITRWVLEAATVECRNWPEGVSVSINVSARDFRSNALIRQIDAALKTSGLPADRLEIEVTETTLIEERDIAAQRLDELAARGIGIALDDFGTGYSSLSYLHEMPFTKLKIDRSFIADVTTNPRSRKLMTNVARLGKDLGLVVTAEGVETEDQLEVITSQTDVDQVQGYLFGMPLPASEISKLIAHLSGPKTGQDRRRG
jgi:diguanylate cyclase (GGDEF)-like protein